MFYNNLLSHLSVLTRSGLVIWCQQHHKQNAKPIEFQAFILKISDVIKTNFVNYDYTKFVILDKKVKNVHRFDATIPKNMKI